MQILALDVGTSSVKAAVLDVADGTAVGPIGRAPCRLEQTEPEAAVLDPEATWQAIGSASRAAATGQKVEGVGISCLSPAWILLDAADRPLTPLVTHLDRRARPLARQIWNEHGQDFLRSTGNKPLPGGMSGIGCRFLLQQRPDLTARIRRYLHCNGWLGLRLTGNTAFDPGNASFTGLYDTMGSQTWSTRWCGVLGIDLDWLPPVWSGDRTLGPLLPETAQHLGVSAGIPVKLGTADTSCAMLAAGMGPRDLLHVVGTTQVLARHAAAPVPAENRLTRQLGVGTSYIHVTHNPVGGAALDWMHQLCFRDLSASEFYGKAVRLALERPVEAVLDPPFLGGDRLEIEPRRAGFQQLGLATDRIDLLAAVLDAIRRHHRTALEALGTPQNFERVFLTGGGADVVAQLIEEYRQWTIARLDEGSLRGVAALFRA